MKLGADRKKILIAVGAALVVLVVLVMVLSRGGGVFGQQDVRQGMDSIRTAINDEELTTITVLGDVSSTGEHNWVELWAEEHLADTHAVTYRTYDPATEDYAPPRTFSEEGPPVEIRNGSLRGATLDSTRENLDVLYAEPTDVVILNLGHNDAPAEMAGQITSLWEAIYDQAPTRGLVVIQNPETAFPEAQQTRMGTMAATAEELELPTVDIYAAFMDSEEPLPHLVLASVPTEAGHRLWAEQMHFAFDEEAAAEAERARKEAERDGERAPEEGTSAGDRDPAAEAPGSADFRTPEEGGNSTAEDPDGE